MFWDMYPWTDFHKLNLDWILMQTKKALEEWEVVKGDFSSLEEYVRDYFDNLDVSEEVSAVIDRMITDGTFNELLNPDVETAVDAWLSTHITPTAPPLDDTLMLANAAAQAKAVGDRFDFTQYNWLTYWGKEAVECGYTHGAWDRNSGALSTSVTSAIAIDKLEIFPGMSVIHKNQHRALMSRLVFYDGDGVVLPSYSTGFITDQFYKISDYAPSNAASVGITVARNPAGTIPASQTHIIKDDIIVFNSTDSFYTDYLNSKANIASNANNISGNSDSIAALERAKNNFLPLAGDKISVTWEKGSASINNGGLSPSTDTWNNNHSRRTGYVPFTGYEAVIFNRDWMANPQRWSCAMVFYDESYTFISSTGFNYYSTYYELARIAPDNTAFFIVTLTVTGAVISDIENVTYPTTTYILDTTNSPLKSIESIESAVALANDARYDFKGKVIAVLGDSISTNGNYSATNPKGNVPEIVIQNEDVGVSLSAYLTQYDKNAKLAIGGTTFTQAQVGTRVTFTPTAEDVGKFIGRSLNNNPASMQVWWETVAEKLECEVIPVCWSGSSLSSHQGEVNDYKTSYGWHPAQILKMGKRTPGTMNRTAPDVVIVFRGVNDYSHTPTTHCDPYTFESTVNPPQGDSQDGQYLWDMALYITYTKIKEAYPNAKIIFGTIPTVARDSSLDKPPYRNDKGDSVARYNDSIKRFAEYVGCNVIDFYRCGYDYYNLDTFTGDRTHPNDAGQRLLANRAILDLLQVNGGN